MIGCWPRGARYQPTTTRHPTGGDDGGQYEAVNHVTPRRLDDAPNRSCSSCTALNSPQSKLSSGLSTLSRHPASNSNRASITVRSLGIEHLSPRAARSRSLRRVAFVTTCSAQITYLAETIPNRSTCKREPIELLWYIGHRAVSYGS